LRSGLTLKLHIGGNMIYLLEGVDGSGKTTYLNKRFPDYEKFHFGAFPTPSAAFQAYDELLDAIWIRSMQGQCPKIVIDRMHVSEQIYGEVYHGIRMSKRRFDYLDDCLLQLGALCIWFHPPWQIVKENWTARIDDEMVKEETALFEVYQAYERISDITRLPVFKYDYTKEA
jgi:hypothetical protein